MARDDENDFGGITKWWNPETGMLEPFEKPDPEDMGIVEEEEIEESTRPMWDEFVEKWFGVAPYDQTAAQANFNKFFDTATPGEMQPWAGGKLMMGGEGVAHYVSPTGQVVKFTSDTPLQELYEENPEIKAALDAAYPTNTMEDVVTGHTDFVADEANIYNEAIQGATDTQQGTLNDLTGQLDIATNVQNELLNSLISDAQSGTGYYSPVSFGLGNQNISFVPRANREMGTNITNMGQDRLGNVQNFVDAAGLNANTIFDSANQTAQNIFGNAQVRSPFAGNLAYLSSLTNAMGQEETRRQADLDNIYRDAALKAGIGISNRKLDQEEPGFVGQAGGVIDLISSIAGLGKLF